jgi:hypothetical protein
MAAVTITMPPWLSDDEAEILGGKLEATVRDD